MGRRFGYFFRETAAALRRNGLVTLAAIATVFISLFLLGASLLARQQVNMMIDLWTQNVEVSVFLREGVSGEEVQQLGREIAGMPEVASAEFESKEEAYEHFRELFKESPALVENVSADSLPASYQVKLHNPEDFEVIDARLAGNAAIEEIRDNRGLVNRLLDLTRILRTGALAVALIMLVAAMGLIGNTVRMAVFARRREIAIMKLVGATNWFIRIPFLIEGMVQGLLGAGVAILTLFVMKYLFIDPLRGGQSLTNIIPWFGNEQILVTVPILVVAGILIAVVASLFAMRRFLEV